MPGLIVIGAGLQAAAILGRFRSDGWRVAAIVSSRDAAGTDLADTVSARDPGRVTGDAGEPESLRKALSQARDELAGVSIIVNAPSVPRRWPGEPFGGGPIADASLEQYQRWGTALAATTFVFLSEGACLLREAGDGGSLIQVTGSAGRRARPGEGLWTAGHIAARALVQAAAQELRSEGIRACHLLIDAAVGPTRELAALAGEGETVVQQEEVAGAVAFLAAQSRSGMTYELELTTAGQPWIP
jgi:NADP-dependent 3-hydroxy acid dehydrogenase YdfG